MSRSFTAGVLCALAIVVVAGCSSKSQKAPAPQRTVITNLVGSVSPGQAMAVVRVPEAQDGATGSNPPGTIEIFSRSDSPLTVDNSPYGARPRCPYDPTLWSTVTIANYATEQLKNIAVQFIDVTPIINKPCNNWPAVPPADPYPSQSQPAVALISYGNLAGSAVSDGSAAGGTADREWWFQWSAQAGFSFRARVWADVIPTPPSAGLPAAGGTLLTTDRPHLTFNSGSYDVLVQVSTDPTFASTIEAYLLHSNSYAWDVQVATTPVPGTVYYWKAVNRFVQPGGTDLVNGTFSTGGSYQVGPRARTPDKGRFFTGGAQSVYLDALLPTNWTRATFSICSGAPPCTTPITNGTHISTAVQIDTNWLASWDGLSLTLDPGRYTWRVTSPDGLPGYSESGFYVDAPPTNLHSEWAGNYNHRFYADSFAPWVDFYWWSDDPAFTSGNPAPTAAQARLDTVRIIGPPTFTAVEWPGIHVLHWRACTQYGATSNNDGAGVVATQGSCVWGPDYIDTNH